MKERRMFKTAFLVIMLCTLLAACSGKTEGKKDASMQTAPPEDSSAGAYTVSAAVELPEGFGTSVQRLPPSDSSDGKMIVMTDDDTLYFWGGADGTSDTHPRSGQLTRITWREAPAFIFLSRFALCYVDSDGNLWWGKFYSSPVLLAENIVYAEAFLNFGFALTAEGTLSAWCVEPEPAEVFQDVRAARSYGDEVFAIKNDDSLWKLPGFGMGRFLTSPEAEWVMDDVREISGHLVLLNDGTVRDLDAYTDQPSIPEEVTHVASNGLNHAAVCADGSLYLWGAFHAPGNWQERLTLDAPVLLCENVSDAVPCYSGVLILNSAGELMVCELDNGELVVSPAVS